MEAADQVQAPPQEAQWALFVRWFRALQAIHQPAGLGRIAPAFCSEDRSEYEYYKGLADGNLTQTATLIAEAFYDHLWQSAEYKDQEQNKTRVVESDAPELAALAVCLL